MCGIAGVIVVDGRPTWFPGLASQLSRAMRHRGPDDEGYLLAPGAGRDVLIYGGTITPLAGGGPPYLPDQRLQAEDEARPALAWLVHRRLSIIDCAPTGHQPMTTTERRFWIVYNGEIYNVPELRPELEARGVQFYGSSDTEVLLQAYLAWGADALDRLNGMFAFAIWDNDRQELFCARDRIGIKPLHYAFVDGLFVFGSDIKTLLASRLITPEINVEGLYHDLSFGVAPRPLTAFRGIQALEQAHYMRVRVGAAAERRRYWQVPVGRQERGLRFDDARERLRARLTASVGRRLVADRPVGTFMSCGVDSTLISALSAHLHPGIKAFTLHFTGHGGNDVEIPNARQTAAATA